MRIVGVDPGLTGALCLYNTEKELIFIEDMPVVDGRIDAHAFWKIFVRWSQKRVVDLAAVEVQQAFPKQGVSSSFRTGMNYGIILGVLAAHFIPVVFPSPSKWTADLKVGRDKDKHRRLVMETWPRSAGLFARKKDDGRADAALIARWASLQPAMTRTA